MKLVHDLRFTLRSLRRRPLYTAVVVLTLGLGIGSTTAMFSVVNGVMLKPLPFDEPDRLVAIWQTWPNQVTVSTATASPTTPSLVLMGHGA